MGMTQWSETGEGAIRRSMKNTTTRRKRRKMSRISVMPCGRGGCLKIRGWLDADRERQPADYVDVLRDIEGSLMDEAKRAGGMQPGTIQAYADRARSVV